MTGILWGSLFGQPPRTQNENKTHAISSYIPNLEGMSYGLVELRRAPVTAKL